MRKKIGVYICHCGTNIADTVDVKRVCEVIAGEEGVVLTRDVMFACADSSQKEIIEDIRREGLDGLVIASCSPKLHLFTFRSVAERAGLNPYNYVQVNIREQGSWAHSDNKEGATEKAIRMVRAGVARVARSEALERINISAVNTVAVIGARVAGMRTALELAKMGTQVYLIEREHFVGGRTAQWGDLFTTEETGKQIVTRLYEEVMKKENITLFTGAEVIEKEGNIGDFHLKVRIRPRFVKERCDAGELMKAIEVCPVEVEDEFNFGLTKRKAIYRNYESEYPRAAVIDDKACTRCGECVKVCSSIDLEQQEEILTLHAGGIILTTGFDPYEPKTGEFGYGEVEGVISTDSIVRALYHLSDPDLRGGAEIDVMELSVAQCIEEAPVHPGDSDMLAMERRLEETPYLLVGDEGGSLIDILTHYDVVYLFRELAAHFPAIGTIEQLLRTLIAKVLDTPETLAEAIDNAFGYRKENRPRALDDMSLDDYRLLIMNKRNWPKFKPLFFDRQATQNRLLKLRDLRNDLFHFRLHILNPEQRDFIRNTVRWLESLR